jgi:DNA-binding CsgD family transcriptional regulator
MSKPLPLINRLEKGRLWASRSVAGESAHTGPGQSLRSMLDPACELLDGAASVGDIRRVVNAISAISCIRFVSFTRYDDGVFFSENKQRFSTFPAEWHEFMEQSHKTDPSALTVSLTHTSSPQAWCDIYTYAPEHRRLLTIIRELGLTPHGFSLAVRGANGACFTLYCNLECDDESFSGLMANFVPHLVVLSQRMADRLDAIINQSSAPGDDLTAREIECLLMAARGLFIKQTAKELRIAPQTVNFHLQMARLKLGARNTTHAVALSIAKGFIERSGILPLDGHDGHYGDRIRIAAKVVTG